MFDFITNIFKKDSIIGKGLDIYDKSQFTEQERAKLDGARVIRIKVVAFVTKILGYMLLARLALFAIEFVLGFFTLNDISSSAVENAVNFIDNNIVYFITIFGTIVGGSFGVSAIKEFKPYKDNGKATTTKKKA